MNTQEYVSTQSIPEQAEDTNLNSGAISRQNVIHILSKKVSGEVDRDLERQEIGHEKLINDMHASLHFRKRSIDRILTGAASPVKSMLSSPKLKDNKSDVSNEKKQSLHIISHSRKSSMLKNFNELNGLFTRKESDHRDAAVISQEFELKPKPLLSNH